MITRTLPYTKLACMICCDLRVPGCACRIVSTNFRLVETSVPEGGVMLFRCVVVEHHPNPRLCGGRSN